MFVAHVFRLTQLAKNHCWCAFFRPTEIWQGQNQWGKLMNKKQQCVEIIPRQHDQKYRCNKSLRWCPVSTQLSLYYIITLCWQVHFRYSIADIPDILSWLLGVKTKPIPEPGKNERKWLSVEITGNKAPGHMEISYFRCFPWIHGTALF